METSQEIQFDQKLENDWLQIAKKKDVLDTLANNDIRILDEGALFAIYNKKTDITRLIVSEGTGDSLPKVEFGAGEFSDDKDPFEDQLEDALCVFKSGGVDTDIL